ncbi:hypothetical protein OUZ56_031727 [Daphnia magna]|uniref:Uncharacterized protein n=1 Tax=Daphnia magna TaxID=35525 RepID=A0ABQ9ZV12_9CRUS|nr:hypothetical protein OUZ56_031727 [Daphnia magna]
MELLMLPIAILIILGPNSVYVVYAPLYNPINFRLRSSSAENLFGKQILNKELGGTVERKIFAMGNLRSK